MFGRLTLADLQKKASVEKNAVQEDPKPSKVSYFENVWFMFEMSIRLLIFAFRGLHGLI